MRRLSGPQRRRAPSPALRDRAGRARVLHDRARRRRAPRSRQRDRRPSRSARKPHAGGVLTARHATGNSRPSAIPTVTNANRGRRQDGRTARRHLPARPTVDLGTLVHGHRALSRSPRRTSGRTTTSGPAKPARTKAAGCRRASELVGAADTVKLESTIHDSQLTATINLDPTRGLKDEREMSSTLVTTEAGSAAAGFEGVSEGATGDPRQGQANPIPLPANPLPESLQYVTVYDNEQQGRLRRLPADHRTPELPLRLQQDTGRAEQSRTLKRVPARIDAPTALPAESTHRAARWSRPRCSLALAVRAGGAVILPAQTIDGPSRGHRRLRRRRDGRRRHRRPRLSQARRRRPARVRLALRRRALAGADPGRHRRALRRQLAAHRRGRTAAS